MTPEQRKLYRETFGGMDAEERDEMLQEWFDEGGCQAACPQACWVESDGDCEHGHPAWLKLLGYV